MRKLIQIFLTFSLMAFSLPTISTAANPYSAAYTVNDSIITHYDITERTKLLRALGVPSNGIEETAIDQLIDDRLKVRAALSFGMAINPDALSNGINSIAEQRDTTADALWAKARGHGVSRPAFDAYFEAQLIWRALVQRRFRQLADPTSVELDNAINVAAAVTQETILLAEIALPFAERGEEATIAFAERLARDLNNGASFDDAVTRFSRSRTAANGGQIGWVAPERLPAAIASKVLRLRAGQVSQPVIVSSGVIILKVLASKVTSSALQKQVTVEYAVLDFAGMPGAISRATRMQHGLDECSASTSSVADYGPESGLFGPVSVDEVPADIAVSLARLMPSKSEVVANGDSVKLIQLCNRTTDLPEAVKTQLRGGVFGEKLAKLAEGYLLELRRIAIIEKR